MQGRQAHHTYLTQRSYGMMGEGWTDHSPVPADLGVDVGDIACKIILITSTFFADGNRPSQEPACRFQPDFQPNSQFPFDVTSIPVRFSQSDFPLSTEEGWVASEQFDSFSKDIERFSSHSFSLLIIQFLLSGLTGVFLRVRCIPHQDSQRCFWASVWFMLDSSRWHEPLGGSLSKLRIDTLKRPLNLHFWISNSFK